MKKSLAKLGGNSFTLTYYSSVGGSKQELSWKKIILVTDSDSGRLKAGRKIRKVDNSG